MTRTRGFRLAIAIVVAGSALLLGNVRLLLVRHAAAITIGVGIDDKDGALVVTGLQPGGPAERAGIRTGDRIVRIGGQPVSSFSQYDEVADHFERARPVAFEVQRDGVPVSVEVSPGVPTDWWPAVADLAVAACYLALVFLSVVRREQDLRATLLAAFSAAVTLELTLPLGLVSSEITQQLANAGFYLLTGIQFGLFVHLVAVTPRRAAWMQRRGWLIPLAYAAGLSGAGLVGFASITQTPLGGPNGVDPATMDWAFNSIGLSLWGALVAAILVGQVRTARSPVERQQAALVLAGATPWAAFMVVSGVTSILGGALPDWLFNLQQLLLLCFPVALFVAMFRYQLYDLELVVRRSMVYTTLTGALLLIFYAALGAGGALVSRWVEGGASVAVIAAATLLLGLLFSPLRRMLEGIIERRVFPERQAQRQRLVTLAAELPALGKVPAMGRFLVERLGEVFDARKVTLLLTDPISRLLVTVASTVRNPERDFDQSFLLSPEDAGVVALRRSRRPLTAAALVPRSASLAQRMRVFGAALVVPILHHEQLVGILLLGEKASGAPFRAEEMELLTLLAHHAATVFTNARLFESATVDGLTGLLRREVVIEHLGLELQRAVRHRRPLAVGMADLDEFKEVNDAHGHLVGDALLKLVADAIRTELRGADVVGRFGGEEFLLVLPETDLVGARSVADKVRRSVEQVALPLESGEVVTVTISIGLATLAEIERGATDAAARLIERADNRLLSAKSAGRNRIESEEVAE